MPQTSRQPHFTTREFERSHGKKPRGFGMWAFAFDQDDAPWFTNGGCSFTEAKKQAMAEAKRRGATEVRVQP